MSKWSTKLTNSFTGEAITLTANDKFVLQTKVAQKQAQWTVQHDRLQQRELKEQAAAQAKEQTADAQSEIAAYKGILTATLSVDDKVDWEQLRKQDAFPRPEPKLSDYLAIDPKMKFFGFVPLVKSSIDKKQADAQTKLEEAAENYSKEKQEFLQQQATFNADLAAKQQRYEAGDKGGVTDYLHLVLDRSKYPDSLNLNYDLSYEPNGKVLLVEVEMPHKDKVPKVTEYVFSPSKQETSTREMKAKEFEEFYNATLYQIAIRTMHEVFESDYAGTVDMAVLNGIVEGFDPKTGKDFRNCIVSVQVTKSQFSELNLERIAPQECFRYLKGVSAGSLVNLAPVRPIMILNKEDNRIIQADDILDGFDENRNLATMDWQQFEVLTRDLLQKEFGTSGCKVEVTRASRDLGVDAIVFDEDPIRGGKFMIQAKRYNNLVPVSAVRDLFGTVMNEGAVKGILVTTSYYGPESLEFVKNKPLTLINGEELMYLFNKHGYKLKIEIQKKQAAASYSPY